MKFNLSKQWRTYLSNLCVENNYPSLEVSDFLASLEELEERAAEAEAEIRNVRRRKMGLKTTSTTTFTKKTVASSMNVPRPISTTSLAVGSNSVIKDDHHDDHYHLLSSINMDDFGPEDVDGDGIIPISEDFDSAMMLLMGQESSGMLDVAPSNPFDTTYRDWTTAGDPFLAAITMYMEENNLPFQYVDCWVPSFTPKEKPDDDNIRLLPAGFATRDDQNEDLTAALVAFGQYSKSFSFKPGRGLPGRVYISGKSAWQSSLNDVHTSVFARSGGAKAYGLKTAAAIPFSAPGVGRMVVVMYSTHHMQKDDELINRCATELAMFAPQPKWKLVIELGTGTKSDTSSATQIAELNPASFEPTFNLAAANAVEPSEQSSGHCPSPSYSNKSDDDDDLIEKKLISLLGGQIPALHSVQSGQSSSALAGDMKDVLPDIMRMRLLLLRPVSRRSNDDNDAIDILKSSFKNYTEESKRSDSEIAMLLAREWQCLIQSFSLTLSSPAQRPREPMAYPSPVLEDTKVPTSSLGVPDMYQTHVLDGNASSSTPLVQPGMDVKPAGQSSQTSGMICYDHSKPNAPSPIPNESIGGTRRVSVGDQASAYMTDKLR